MSAGAGSFSSRKKSTVRCLRITEGRMGHFRYLSCSTFRNSDFFYVLDQSDSCILDQPL